MVRWRALTLLAGADYFADFLRASLASRAFLASASTRLRARSDSALSLPFLGAAIYLTSLGFGFGFGFGSRFGNGSARNGHRMPK